MARPAASQNGALRRWSPATKNATTIAAYYALFGALWILTTGGILHRLVPDPALVGTLENIKGWFFIAVTAWLLWLGTGHQFREVSRAQQEALTSRATLEAALASMTDAVFVSDKNGHFVLVNDAFAAFHKYGTVADCPKTLEGYAAQIELRSADGEIVPLETWPVPRAIRGESVANAVFTLRRKDTGESWVGSFSFAPIQDASGAITGSVVTGRDITEMKRVEEAMYQSEAELRATFEVIPIGFAQADPSTGRFLRINHKMCAITGYSAEELLEKGFRDITHPLDREADWALFQKVIEGKLPSYRVEKRYVRKDRSDVWVNVNVTALRGPNGTPLRSVASIEDIAERRRAEGFRHVLLSLGDRLNKTRDAVAAGRALLDTAAQLFRWDAATLSLTTPGGDQPEPVLRVETREGRRREIPMVDGAPNADTDVPSFRPRASSIMAPIHRDTLTIGLLSLESDTPNAYTEEDRQTLGVLADYCGAALDRIRTEGELRQAQKLEAVGQLAGGVAHDLNNILAAIMMNVGLMETSPSLDDELRQAVRDLEREAERAAGLTQQLLMFSRRSVLSVSPVNLNDIVANILKMLSRVIGEHVDLRFEAQNSIPAVDADTGMIEQVIMNLVVNARDAMPKGGRITLSTSVLTLDPHEKPTVVANPGRFVCLSVADTGTGMDAATKKRIFEPFFTTKEPGKGTGLGLATVHGIVAQHHGWVEVDSELGRGSTFRVILPATTVQTTKPESIAPEPLHGGNETLLLVEDDERVRELATNTLERLGYQVHRAKTGREALELWKAHGHTIQLVFTDMVMPEALTGLDLIERIQAERSSVPAIISSGYSAEIVRRGNPSQRGITYFPKPYDARALATVVRAVLDQASPMGSSR